MKHIFRICSFLVLSLSIQAQNESNSPYSRFGIGELHNFSTATQSAMGGVGIADNDPYSININNPASYSTIFKQRFIMQTGGFHTTKLLQTNTQNQVVNPPRGMGDLHILERVCPYPTNNYLFWFENQFFIIFIPTIKFQITIKN